MIYNIDYEIAAVIFLSAFLIFHKLKYTSDSKSSVLYRWLIISMLVSTVADMITAITISYAASLPLWVNLSLNTLFFLVAPGAAFVLNIYIRSLFTRERAFDRLILINSYLYFVYAGVALISPFTGLMFSFDNDFRYVHGPLYGLSYFMPVLYMVTVLYMIKREWSKIALAHKLALVLFDLVSMFGVILQMLVTKQVLVSYFISAVCILILLFSLETPDYVQLMRTMKELEQAREEAEAANRGKSEFITSMSHEIRTPMYALIGITQIIEERSQDPSILPYLHDMRDAGDTLVNLVDDILDTSKIEAGEMQLIPVEYSVAEMIHRVYSIVRFKAEEKKLSFIIEADPLIPAVLIGDEARIRQIIINLLSNAVKFTSAGSVKLGLTFDRDTSKQITLIITIRDTGVIISEADQKKLFDYMNYTDETVHSYSRENNLLGLSLVKDFMDMMNGSVTVKCIEGVGTTFMLKIPQQIATNRPMGDYQKLEEMRADKIIVDNRDFSAYKALIVDDMKVNTLVTEGLLKSTGIEIEEAESGEECLDKVSKKKYDVILLDHMMPNMDGIETLKRMNQMDTLNKDTPVIVLTANVLVGAREEYMKLGFADYISKPVNKFELISTLGLYLK